jgi:hypothetical protein
MSTQQAFSDWDVEAVIKYERFTSFMRLVKDLKFKHPELYAEHGNALSWATDVIEGFYEDEITHGENIIVESEIEGVDIFAEEPRMTKIWDTL